MTERPILFSDAMVRAILDGRKTQTRRLVAIEHHPDLGHDWAACLCREIDPSDTPCEICAARFEPIYANAGDRLWVRETWAPHVDDERAYRADRQWSAAIYYRAVPELRERHIISRGGPKPRINRWRPSIHMPRWASRITLDVTSVRVERLQAITEADAETEGVLHADTSYGLDPVTDFRALWDSINAKRAPWKSNPWVWVVTFKVIK